MKNLDKYKRLQKEDSTAGPCKRSLEALEGRSFMNYMSTVRWSFIYSYMKIKRPGIYVFLKKWSELKVELLITYIK